MGSKNEQEISREIALENYKVEVDEALRRLQFQIEYSQSALRNLNLVNGGAIVALLTFIGNSEACFNLSVMKWAFGFFSAGLCFSLCAYAGAFFSQHHFMNVSYSQAWNAQLIARGRAKEHKTEKHLSKGNCAMIAGIVAAILSLILFVIGAFVALSGLVK